MEANNVHTVYVEDGKRGSETRTDAIESLRRGDELAVLHVMLLADPKRKRIRGGIRADLWATVDAIEAKDASVWELSTGLRSGIAKQRDEMMRAAVEALALGRHKTRQNDKRGRPPWIPSEDETAKAKAIWESRKHKTSAAALDAIKAQCSKRWTKTRAYRMFGARLET